MYNNAAQCVESGFIITILLCHWRIKKLKETLNMLNNVMKKIEFSNFILVSLVFVLLMLNKSPRHVKPIIRLVLELKGVEPPRNNLFVAVLAFKLIRQLKGNNGNGNQYQSVNCFPQK